MLHTMSHIKTETATMINGISPNFAKDTQPHEAARIHQSWLRCAGLDKQLLTDISPVSRSSLKYKREANHLLLQNASASLNALGSLAASLNSVVVLTDPSGLIIFELGCNSFQHETHKIALQAGVNWSEQLKGTNAIGTALYDGKAVRIHGSEHFIADNKILSCHAAPIFSATGQILGILDVSGSASNMHSHTLEIVKNMALNIANQILDNTDSNRLEFCLGGANPGSENRAILLLNDDSCITGANETALRLLNTDWNLIGTNYEQWLDGKLSTSYSKLYRYDGQLITGQLKLKQKSIYFTAPINENTDFPVSFNAQQQDLINQSINAINGDLAILLHGETGTGKELFAKQIYQHSKWQKGPFIAINCAALPEQLIESELFGYAPGAFTGAKKDGHKGLLLQANNGILFLDEIGDMPIMLQARLLRVLQERKVQPLGANKYIDLNFGLISATNQNLTSLIEQAKFRSDLYYRLQDMPIELPALRSRPDLLEFIESTYGHMGGRLSTEALSLLANYGWPGNYRELRSILLRLVSQYPQQQILPEMLPDNLKFTDISLVPMSPSANNNKHVHLKQNSSINLQEIEKMAIERAIQEHNGNISLAAKHLGIHRSTLYRKLKG